MKLLLLWRRRSSPPGKAQTAAPPRPMPPSSKRAAALARAGGGTAPPAGGAHAHAGRGREPAIQLVSPPARAAATPSCSPTPSSSCRPSSGGVARGPRGSSAFPNRSQRRSRSPLASEREAAILRDMGQLSYLEESAPLQQMSSSPPAPTRAAATRAAIQEQG